MGIFKCCDLITCILDILCFCSLLFYLPLVLSWTWMLLSFLVVCLPFYIPWTWLPLAVELSPRKCSSQQICWLSWFFASCMVSYLYALTIEDMFCFNKLTATWASSWLYLEMSSNMSQRFLTSMFGGTLIYFFGISMVDFGVMSSYAL